MIDFLRRSLDHSFGEIIRPLYDMRNLLHPTWGTSIQQRRGRKQLWTLTNSTTTAVTCNHGGIAFWPWRKSFSWSKPWTHRQVSYTVELLFDRGAEAFRGASHALCDSAAALLYPNLYTLPLNCMWKETNRHGDETAKSFCEWILIALNTANAKIRTHNLRSLMKLLYITLLHNLAH
jgi:hypothetical protein